MKKFLKFYAFNIQFNLCVSFSSNELSFSAIIFLFLSRFLNFFCLSNFITNHTLIIFWSFLIFDLFYIFPRKMQQRYNEFQNKHFFIRFLNKLNSFSMSIKYEKKKISLFKNMKVAPSFHPFISSKF